MSVLSQGGKKSKGVTCYISDVSDASHPNMHAVQVLQPRDLPPGGAILRILQLVIPKMISRIVVLSEERPPKGCGAGARYFSYSKPSLLISRCPAKLIRILDLFSAISESKIGDGLRGIFETIQRRGIG